MPLDINKAIDLRSQCKHFRILVIGRANAGKTTLLKKVCNSIENPMIFSPSDKKIEASVIEGSAERGLHDIENQLIFKSNPQFIFHDTRGFESGSVAETEKVKAFIAGCAGSGTLADQLHAIWYCLPTDTNRPLLAADEQFFNTDVTGKVPVIAIFTMFDGLITEAFTQLKGGGLNRKEAKDGQIKQAQEMLTTKFVKPLMSTSYPPTDHVQLDDMRVEANNCNELIETTANALSDDTLQLLFVSVQQNNINLSIHYAVNKALEKTNTGDIMRTTLAYFPHVWNNTAYESSSLWLSELLLEEELEEESLLEEELEEELSSLLSSLLLPESFQENLEACTPMFETHYPSAQFPKTESGRAMIIAAICICAEQTFTEASALRLQFSPAFQAALNAYVGSKIQADVNGKIAEFLEQDFAETIGERYRKKKKITPKLVEIIMDHPLRLQV